MEAQKVVAESTECNVKAKTPTVMLTDTLCAVSD